MSLKKALLGATLLSLPLAAQAQPVTGIYIGAGAGANYRDISNSSLSGPATAVAVAPGRFIGTGVNEAYRWGYAGVLSIGYGFGNGLRLELEGNYRENDVRRERTAGVRLIQPSGYARTYGFMGNIFYDFDLRSFGLPIPLIPYVGGGVGLGYSENKHAGGNFATFPFGTRSNDTSSGELAYQAIGGLAFPIDAVPGLAITTEYRYYALANDPRVNYAVQSFRTTPSTFTTGQLRQRDENHTIMLGVRYNFGVAPPPPPPPPVAVVPAPARTYLVFFDWDRADLTDRARQIIAEAANASRTQQVTRLEVNGYTDRSGTVPYNQRLSIRRAESVAAQLVRDGVPRGAIFIQGFGETRNLVPTADGVREPQNRRVEIILR